MADSYSYVREFDGINVTREDAIEEAKHTILDLYHEDLRDQKRKLISYMADWLGEIDDALQAEYGDLMDEQYDAEKAMTITDVLNGVSDGIEKFKDGVTEMSKTISSGINKLCQPCYCGGDVDINVDDLIKHAPKELQDNIAKAANVVSSNDVDVDDDDDIEIEGDLVTPGANFSTREPLTDRDDDDFTPEEEEALTAPTNSAVIGEGIYHSASMMLDPLGLKTPIDTTVSDTDLEDDDVDEELAESDPDDLL